MTRGRFWTRTALFASVLTHPSAQATTLTEVDSPISALVQESDPATGDWRAQLDVRTRESHTAIGDGSEGNLTEWRLSAGAAFSPVHVLTFSAEMPVIYRTWQEEGGAVLEDVAAGDLDLRVHIVPIRWTVGEFKIQPHILAGLRIPTGSLMVDESGEALPNETQPSLGDQSGLGGAGFRVAHGPWSLTTTGYFLMWVADLEWAIPGSVFSSVTVVERQLGDKMSLRVGSEYTHSGRLTLRGGSETVVNSGGNVLFATADLDYHSRRMGDVSLGISAPVLQQLNGEHEEGNMVNLGMNRAF